jgi:ankyrin repeat protein
MGRHKIHGDTNRNSRLHRIWANMKARCRNPNNDRFHDYGARGIKVCDEWHDYLTFKEWAMTNGYEDHLTIDRIDVNGNYEPTNCRWVDRCTQQNNMRSNTIIHHNGESHTLAEWSKICGIPYHTLVTRYTRGWTVERLFTK